MISRLSHYSCLVVLAGLAAVSSHADPVPASLQAQYKVILTALDKCDVKAFKVYYAPEYVSVDPSGKSANLTEYMAGINQIMNGAKKGNFTIKYTGSKTDAKTGITAVSFDVNGTITKADGVTTVHEIGTDSWKKVGSTWKEIKTVDKTFEVVAPKPKKK